MMERKYWARMRQMRQQQLYAEVSKYHNNKSKLQHIQHHSIISTIQSSTRSSSASSGSAVDVESIVDLHRSPAKTSTSLPTDDKKPTESESTELEPKDDSATYTEGEEKKEISKEPAEDGEQSPPIASEEQLKEETESAEVEPTGEPEVTEEEDFPHIVL